MAEELQGGGRGNKGGGKRREDLVTESRDEISLLHFLACSRGDLAPSRLSTQPLTREGACKIPKD